MKRLFNLENPIWQFIGNIADMFLLSLFWYLGCIPIFTIGASTTALYYVTLKMTRNQEGYTTSSFIRSFKLNFKQATLVWLPFLLIGMVLAIDFYWCLFGNNPSFVMFLPVFCIVLLIYTHNVFFVFPFLARCENTTKAILKMNFAISLRNFLPILSTIIVTTAIYAVGIFVFWPLLLIAPGLSAYLNSYIYNRILEKYHLELPDK